MTDYLEQRDASCERPRDGFAGARRLGLMAAIIGLWMSTLPTYAATLTLERGWKSAGRSNPEVVRRQDVCSLTGVIAPAGIRLSGRPVRVGRLSTECRPAEPATFTVRSGRARASVDVLPDGAVVWRAGFGRSLALNGIRFRAGSPAASRSSPRPSTPSVARPSVSPQRTAPEQSRARRAVEQVNPSRLPRLATTPIDDDRPALSIEQVESFRVTRCLAPHTPDLPCTFLPSAGPSGEDIVYAGFTYELGVGLDRPATARFREVQINRRHVADGALDDMALSASVPSGTRTGTVQVRMGLPPVANRYSAVELEATTGLRQQPGNGEPVRIPLSLLVDNSYRQAGQTGPAVQTGCLPELSVSASQVAVVPNTQLTYTVGLSCALPFQAQVQLLALNPAIDEGCFAEVNGFPRFQPQLCPAQSHEPAFALRPDQSFVIPPGATSSSITIVVGEREGLPRPVTIHAFFVTGALAGQPGASTVVQFL